MWWKKHFELSNSLQHIQVGQWDCITVQYLLQYLVQQMDKIQEENRKMKK